MFIAKFNQTTSEPFVADKNGQMPFIGEVLAGTATGTIINGTMFHRGELKPNKLYACENFTDPEYPDNIQTKVIGEVGLLEYTELRTKLGEGKIKLSSVEEEAAVSAEA